MSKDSLRATGFPVFANGSQLGALMNIPEIFIHQVVRKPRSFYRRVKIPKRSGGFREIHQPNRRVKALQSWILANILERCVPSSHATAFRKGLSLTDNIEPHKNNRYFLTIDLKEFFPSISEYRVRALFRNIGYDEEASRILSRICTNGIMLPQGAVTSPALANLVAMRLDRRLVGLCTQEGVSYTRYADDLTFSTNAPDRLRRLFQVIRTIIVSEGFTINDRKTRFSGPNDQCIVTSLVKNSSRPLFSYGRKKYRRLRVAIHRQKSAGGFKWPIDYFSADRLNGIIGYVEHISPHLGKALRKQLAKY